MRVLPEADAKIVFDRFHIAMHLGKAVDQVRRSENRKPMTEGDTRLVRSKYLWLFNEANVPEPRQAEFGRHRNRSTRGAHGLTRSDFTVTDQESRAAKFRRATTPARRNLAVRARA